MKVAENKSGNLLPIWLVVCAAVSFQISATGAVTQPTTQPSPTTVPSPDDRFVIANTLLAEDFTNIDNWQYELEAGGVVRAKDSALEIDVPAGCTVWLKKPFEGPIMVEYEATVISAGGANDRVSDLNCFWMARDSRSPDDLFATKRGGKFAEYNRLTCYYVGLGGNGNTTTRFRRYIGDEAVRPLLPEHDLSGKSDLIVANAPQVVRLVACGKLVQFYRDDRRLFQLLDDAPYTSGWFAFRTTANHMLVKRFRVYRLAPKS